MSSDNTQPTAERKSAIKQRHAQTAEDVLPEHRELYIGGEWVRSASGETFETRDPTTGETLATLQAGVEADIDNAVEAAWKGYNTVYSDYSTADRQALLQEIADRVEANKEAFAQLESLDNGKPITEARIDIELVVDHFRYFAGLARSHKGETIETDDSRSVQTYNEPYGVVGQIIPWNFPLLMAAWKLAPALAAGNAVVLKPAEETPLSVLKLMEEAGDVIPDGVVNVVTGFGTEAGAPLASHEDIRKVAFTGSTEVGSEVMKSAAENITDITLELGGKSPLVVFPDADLEQAVRTTITAIFFNTGECCCAGSRLFVHEDVKTEFLDELAAAAAELVVGDPLLESTDIGPKVSEEQVKNTMSYIEEARDSGASFLTGGAQPDDEALADGCFVTPTLIDEIDHNNRAVQEEIFGPVQEVFTWSDYDEMIELANDVDYGLAAGILTQDLTKAHQCAKDIEAGNIWVNTYNDFPAGQPFGGYKKSGIGRETSQKAIDHYTQTKTVNFSLQ
ncbi:aldehyde dehydrogenase (acceptor) [Halogeometricum borinquense DSM 11551]|uniref:Aldehyde dehydrogenase (Acceptor) n=1 Tax=Halogeometricum borinquense (strain ATCC 700274 / DSM 11551 / JCM 10706 / KCTC 4070 / PR3) TaxID=469382 RepID=E4NVS5_HALBP|nr:aldehyde dehydrogenase family protein [Halogeometricum borinquense]ADQ69145.1 aldehyde dehydrogenase (acceptor) [Halogeometricum borinquense DSM 11551]ELY31817.1 aldehyde dehydrogenase (acceptor) [Halogeometricum borinquense DSM 11551]